MLETWRSDSYLDAACPYWTCVRRLCTRVSMSRSQGSRAPFSHALRVFADPAAAGGRTGGRGGQDARKELSVWGRHSCGAIAITLRRPCALYDHGPAYPAALSFGEYARRRRNVLSNDAERLVQGNFVCIAAPRNAAGEHIADLADDV